MKDKHISWKCTLAVLLLLPFFLLGTSLLIHRSIYGEYGFGVHALIVLIIGLALFILVFSFLVYQFRLPVWCVCILAGVFALGAMLYYLSSNGLWCAQHSSVTREMCAKLKEFALFASTANLHSWWLTLGDLLAIQRGRATPLAWGHDIDICITPEEFPRFEKALFSRGGYFEPNPVLYGNGHWYIPIDMAKLGLRAREAEGVNIHVWACSKTFKGNISRVLYCEGYMNVPGSASDRHMLLTTEYGDYSVVKYEHHENMCRLWNG
jgi:hypothetical protein